MVSTLKQRVSCPFLTISRKCRSLTSPLPEQKCFKMTSNPLWAHAKSMDRISDVPDRTSIVIWAEHWRNRNAVFATVNQSQFSISKLQIKIKLILASVDNCYPREQNVLDQRPEVRLWGAANEVRSPAQTVSRVASYVQPFESPWLDRSPWEFRSDSTCITLGMVFPISPQIFIFLRPAVR